MKLPRRSAEASVIGAVEAIDHRRDLDDLGRAAQPADDLLGVRPRRRRRRAIRHQHAQQPFRPDGLGHEVRDERRIDAARQPQHRALEAGLAELAADELGDDPPGDIGVDGQLRRQLERDRAGHRATPSRPPAPRRKPIGWGARSPGATSSPGSAPGSLVESWRQPGALGDDPVQLAQLELGSLVAQQRQPDALAPDVGDGDIDAEQALVVQRRAQERRSGRAR